MTRLLVTNIFCTLMFCAIAKAQDIDSTFNNLQQLPTKFTNDIDKKIDQYSNRITIKTEKTLTKLSRWTGLVDFKLEGVFGTVMDD